MNKYSQTPSKGFGEKTSDFLFSVFFLKSIHASDAVTNLHLIIFTSLDVYFLLSLSVRFLEPDYFRSPLVCHKLMLLTILFSVLMYIRYETNADDQTKDSAATTDTPAASGKT